MEIITKTQENGSTKETVKDIYNHQTPSIEEGYTGIARKTAQNGLLALRLLCAAPLITGACIMKSGALVVGGLIAGGTTALIGCSFALATPFILVKDLAHHTWRVLTPK